MFVWCASCWARTGEEYRHHRRRRCKCAGERLTRTRFSRLFLCAFNGWGTFTSKLLRRQVRWRFGTEGLTDRACGLLRMTHTRAHSSPPPPPGLPPLLRLRYTRVAQGCLDYTGRSLERLPLPAHHTVGVAAHVLHDLLKVLGKLLLQNRLVRHVVPLKHHALPDNGPIRDVQEDHLTLSLPSRRRVVWVLAGGGAQYHASGRDAANLARFQVRNHEHKAVHEVLLLYELLQSTEDRARLVVAQHVQLRAEVNLLDVQLLALRVARHLQHLANGKTAARHGRRVLSAGRRSAILRLPLRDRSGDSGRGYRLGG
ncbi:tyrosyl or methionyl-tRNA synthetase-like protein [Leishmania tarentolae]|uniref:Tyrosyl or methionyl-tRNA synthetase-like protein n=1 Tax=Leishmania tarentolae TaxID=5689 RepID=A0A640KEJ3_LEITA|nr:tyrosyl or methionyl-tRNA synthetase-like protein [Leishmania tarentolae]